MGRSPQNWLRGCLYSPTPQNYERVVGCGRTSYHFFWLSLWESVAHAWSWDIYQIGFKQFRLLPSSQNGGSKIKSFLCDVNFEKSNYSIHHYQGKVAWTQHLHMPGSYQSSLKYIREWVTKAKQWSDLGPIKWQNMAGLPTSHYGSKGSKMVPDGQCNGGDRLKPWNDTYLFLMRKDAN